MFLASIDRSTSPGQEVGLAAKSYTSTGESRSNIRRVANSDPLLTVLNNPPLPKVSEKQSSLVIAKTMSDPNGIDLPGDIRAS